MKKNTIRLLLLSFTVLLTIGMSTSSALAQSASSSNISPPEPKFSESSVGTLGLPYGDGDIFAGVGTGLIKEFKPDGTFVQTLDTTSGAFEDTGMCFDGLGNLRSTNFGTQTMTLFDSSGTIITHPWAGPFSADPESCVRNAAGDIYVGQADGTRDILKFAPDGTFLAAYDVPAGPRGTDWIDLAADQCTMYYASEGSVIRKYDVCADVPLPDFASGLSGPCYALRIRDNAQVLVACTSQAYLLNADGTVAHTYVNSDFTPAPSLLFALNIDPDGTSFWTADIFSGNIYHMDISTGSQLFTFNAAAPVDVAGLAIFGEPTVAVCPVGTHGTPPNCIPDMVGGQLLPIDATALLVAGAQTNAVWILSALAVIGSVAFGTLYIKTKRD